ncbi:hypothetical protein [Psychrobacter sp. W2-37-MNA-CIBAN-0211]|uniref:hypothetical protein n=1 Tax=Psychrobacter sp. W2-37-MNA-CIBAN-0211 TaxID=3140443 RepID=UPI0033256A34
MKLLDRMAGMLINNRDSGGFSTNATINDVHSQYETLNQFELGTYASREKLPRTRQQIYTMWELMQKDPQISEALNLHVTAALGGHESTGDMIFMTPHDRIRGKGKRAAELRKKVEREARHITPIINKQAFAMARQAIGFGDSFARIYLDKRHGVVGLMNNRHTASPLIMPFEQAGETVGYHALEEEDFERSIAKLTPMQLLRVKMPRSDIVPQMSLQVWQEEKTLIYDKRSDNPILPAEVGGSFLYPIEEAWQDVTISRAGLNNQTIADSVKQAFLTINMEGMPPAQQKKYRKSIVDMLTGYRDQVEDAFKGGEALHGTKYHVMPQWGDKQILNSVGEMSQRNAPLSENNLMINLRRVAGGLGIDLALVGWADMLAGGLGDGAAFHTSAQIMRRSLLIRQANTDAYNHLMSIHWGIKYGEYFEEKDYPWQFDFYSDQNAAAAQALNNKQARANTLTVQTQAIIGIKELGLDRHTAQLMLEDELGYDATTAERIAIAITAPAQDAEGMPMGGQPQSAPNDDDELPAGLGFDDE